MANIKSKKKRILTNEKSRLANAAFKSQVKTAIRKLKEAATKEEAIERYNECAKLVDKGVTKGVYHKNYGSRKVSQLALIRNAK